VLASQTRLVACKALYTGSIAVSASACSVAFGHLPQSMYPPGDDPPAPRLRLRPQDRVTGLANPVLYT